MWFLSCRICCSTSSSIWQTPQQSVTEHDDINKFINDQLVTGIRQWVPHMDSHSTCPISTLCARKALLFRTSSGGRGSSSSGTLGSSAYHHNGGLLKLWNDNVFLARESLPDHLTSKTFPNWLSVCIVQIICEWNAKGVVPLPHLDKQTNPVQW